MRIRARGSSALPALLALSCLFAAPALAQPAKLLITQVETRGNPGDTSVNEYVVIHNPGSSVVDLSDVYLTDATFRSSTSEFTQFYFYLPDEALPIGGGDFADFFARFPDGAEIGAGESVSISVNGSDAFEAAYGRQPHYELYEDGLAPDGVPDMRPARDGSINGNDNPTLTNSGEVVVLFHWDGSSNLVTDLDYFLWGDTRWAVDKTGESITATGNTEAGTYLPDTPVATQAGLMQVADPQGTFVRTDDSEGSQASSGSNGVDGRNETSEPLNTTFTNSTDGVPPGVDPVDTTPPVLLGAGGEAGTTQLGVTFSEPVGDGAGTPANYTVAETANPSNTLAVTGASAASGSGALVTLTLGGELATGTNYTVTVSNVEDLAGNVIAPNSSTAFTPTGGEGFFVAGVYQFGPRQVGVAFSAPVNAAQAVDVSNYTVTGEPGFTLASAAVQDNGSTVILTASGNLPRSGSYQLAVDGVTGSGGGSLVSGGPFAFTTADETITGIADIHANLSGFEDQVVTVIGQMFIPCTVIANQRISGYVQDATGRGLNVFEFTTTVPEPVSDVDRVVKITGTITIFNSVVEIEDFTAVELASEIPPLGPRVLTPQEAASSQWNMSYIQTTSTLAGSFAPAGSGYQNAEAGPIVYRVRENTGINLGAFGSGDEVTGRGAGTEFSGTFQIEVGTADGFFEGGGGPDLTPPTLVSAAGEADGSAVTVTFSEAVGAGAAVAGNYEVYETASPGSTVPVTGAAVGGSTVTLTLGGPLSAATAYTVRVNGVEDLAGNSIVPNSTVGFTPTGGEGFFVAGVYQFGPRQVGVAYSRAPVVAQATDTANYTVTGDPAITFSSAAMQDNGTTVILTATADLPRGGSYALGVANVSAADDSDPLVSGGPFTFATASEQVVAISDIHADLSSYEDQTVTVIGQMFIPCTVIASQRISGYVQDATGRGLNVFEFTTSIPEPVSDVDRVVKITGTITIFNSVVEIEDFTAVQLAAGIPPLGPRVVTPEEAASSEWNMSYIQTSSTLTGGFAPAGSGYQNAEAGPIVYRVRDNTGINLGSFGSGDEVTGRGAGTEFSGTFQIEVGTADGFFEGGGGPDLDPPTLVSATGEAEGATVVVRYNEAVGTGAGVPGNYEVFETAAPGNAVAVTGASASGSQTTLTLGSALAGNTGYTVRVNDVADLAGNVIAPNSTVQFATGGVAEFQVVGMFQFGPRHIGVSFGKKVNPASASAPGNYMVMPQGGAPNLDIQDIVIQENEQMAILVNANPLPRNSTYRIDVSGVTSEDGQGLGTPLVTTVTTVAEEVTGIADIHDDLSAYEDRQVTVTGQMFIPAGVIANQRISGYIQDGTGRGLNVFEFTTSVPPAVGSVDKVTRITGTITVFNTTIEIEDFTAQELASDIPPLGPVVVSPVEAQDARWNMSYIQTTAFLTGTFRPAGTGFQNATAGSGFEFRVRDNLGIDLTQFEVGDEVTGRGAGSAFGNTFQMEIGTPDGLFRGGGDVDTTSTDVAAVEVPARTLLRGSTDGFPVKFGASPGSVVAVRVFDLQGRLVKVLFDGDYAIPGKLTVTWDGRDDFFEYVPTGMYVCHVEAVGPNGSITEAHAPIVVSTRLN